MPDFQSMQDEQEMEDVAGALAGSIPQNYRQPDSRNLSDWYMEFEDDLAHMEHWLKGEHFDANDTKTPWKKHGDPLCNEAGVVFILGYMRGTGLSKNKIMTNFPNWDMAMQRIRGVCFALNRNLHKHYCLGDFSLSLTNVKTINSYAFDLIFASTLRALQGNENKRVRDTSTTATTIMAGHNPQEGRNPTIPHSPLDFLNR
jgi:hypothetical protein